MSNQCVVIEKSMPLHGEAQLAGAKNAVLVIIASLILASGKSRLTSVPVSDDVYNMIALLNNLGAQTQFDAEHGILDVDTSTITSYTVSPEIMKKMRASILVMGPLLARFRKANVALPGGCVLGARPIDYHLRAFAKMGATIEMAQDYIKASAPNFHAERLILEYPSVGATENIIMAAALTPGKTTIVNAAIEPEVLDLIEIMAKMGAQIRITPPATIEIEGVKELKPTEHAIMLDRLEAGSLMLAAAMTGGSISLPTAPAWSMETFNEKLCDMGHTITVGSRGIGLTFTATKYPKAVSIKTMPYPGFPTDLQAPMLAAQCLADGVSTIHETVYENRLVHVRELQKMGAQITIDGQIATIKGTDTLYGAHVIAPDIRASAALVIAGLAAQGQTVMTGIHHLHRGYQDFEKKIAALGGKIYIRDIE